MNSQLRASRGDWLVIERAGVGQAARRGLIVGVRSPDGSPPYVVRWAGYGHTTLMFPGPDARVLSAREVERARSALRSDGPLARFWQWLLRERSGGSRR